MATSVPGPTAYQKLRVVWVRRAGARNAAYCDRPIDPLAIESGAETMSWKTKRKLRKRPVRPERWRAGSGRCHRLRAGGAEFGPDEAIAEGEECAGDPAEHGLGASHGGEQDGQGDEGADADHVEHVERDGAGEGEGAGELGWGLDGASVREDTQGPHLNRGARLRWGTRAVV